MRGGTLRGEGGQGIAWVTVAGQTTDAMGLEGYLGVKPIIKKMGIKLLYYRMWIRDVFLLGPLGSSTYC